MISLSPDAITHLKTLIAEKDSSDGIGLRVRVEKGGCAGMQYVMGLESSSPGDTTLIQDGVAVFVDPSSIEYLRGCQIDYVDTLSDRGFKLVNPNAVRSCGCGTSFEPQTA